MITRAVHTPTDTPCTVIETTLRHAVIEFTKGHPVGVDSREVVIRKFIRRDGQEYEPSEKFMEWQRHR